jgi:5'-nucleotidase
MLAKEAELVISGINQGANLGDDVLISGTVGAALQGYLRKLPSIAVSTANLENSNIEAAARLAALLAARIEKGALPKDVFLNVNMPDLSLEEVRGIKVTELAHRTHIDSVNEGHDGRREYYWLVRRRLSQEVDPQTDIWAIENGFISINALHSSLFGKPPLKESERLSEGLMEELLRSTV